MNKLAIPWLGSLAAILAVTACNQQPQVLIPVEAPPIASIEQEQSLEARKYTQRIIKSETAWVMSLQLSEPQVQPSSSAYGAIIMHDKQLFDSPAGESPVVTAQWKVEPYFANLAITGLLEANPKNKSVRTTTKRWLQWYFNRMSTSEPSDPRCADPNTRIYVSVCDDIPGTVSWHFVNPTSYALTKVMYMDSADSYAATFLTLLHKYYLASKDKAFLVANRAKVRMARDVMVHRTWIASDRRTIAKPSYPIDYLMDNTEVFEALIHIKAMEEELGLLNDTQASATNEALLMQYRINDLQLGLEELFHTPSGLYFNSGDSFKLYNNPNTPNRDQYLPKIDTFYPDATAQLFPIWTGLHEPNSTRAKSLWQQFNANWDRPDNDPLAANHQWTKGQIPDAFPWVVMTYTASVMKDEARASKHLEWLYSTFSTDHQFPWYKAEAGWALRAAAQLHHK